MKKFASSLVHHRKLTLVVFSLLLLLSAYSSTLVRVNYDLSAYVPDDAASTLGMNLVKEEFQDTIPNLDLLVPNLDVADARKLKERLLELPETQRVIWLDDVADLSQPIETLDEQLLDRYYKDKNSLYQIALKSGNYSQILEKIRDLAGEDCAMRGQAVELARANKSTTEEVKQILIFVVPMALIILFIATTSWFEPILFMLTIFAGVLLNMGSNFIFGEISFITQSVGAVFQLAVSMDYAVFMLHRFGEFRQAGFSVEESMIKAIVKAFSSITSSALTTVFGFLALIFMRFKLGPNLGLVLAKGVIFSLISVIFLMPSLVMLTYRVIDKTTHRSFIPSFDKFSKLVLRIAPLVLLIIAIISLPLFRAQQRNRFLYGMGDFPAGSREEQDQKTIEEIFGTTMQMVLLVPEGEPAKEEMLGERLKKESYVQAVISYSSIAGNQIPQEILPEEDLKQLRNGRYSRFIVNCALPPESRKTFDAAERLRAISEEEYGADALWAGQNFVLLDMRNTIKSDNIIVNGLAILSVALVLLLTFRSLTLPLILVFTIELSIWGNLSIPYFQGTQLNYIGYLVISTIQLGATVDYAILSSQNYLYLRKKYAKKEAAQMAISQSAPAIIPPALILSGAGFILHAISSISVVSEIGLVLGRGAALSLLSVLFILPALLYFFDSLIRVSSWKSDFLMPEKRQS